MPISNLGLPVCPDSSKIGVSSWAWPICWLGRQAGALEMFFSTWSMLSFLAEFCLVYFVVWVCFKFYAVRISWAEALQARFFDRSASCFMLNYHFKAVFKLFSSASSCGRSRPPELLENWTSRGSACHIVDSAGGFSISRGFRDIKLLLSVLI